MSRVYKAGAQDYRVRARVAQKWRDVGGIFTTREAAIEHRKKIDKPKAKKE